jgi:hypothetical protein
MHPTWSTDFISESSAEPIYRTSTQAAGLRLTTLCANICNACKETVFLNALDLGGTWTSISGNSHLHGVAVSTCEPIPSLGAIPAFWRTTGSFKQTGLHSSWDRKHCTLVISVDLETARQFEDGQTVNESRRQKLRTNLRFWVISAERSKMTVMPSESHGETLTGSVCVGPFFIRWPCASIYLVLWINLNFIWSESM